MSTTVHATVLQKILKHQFSSVRFVSHSKRCHNFVSKTSKMKQNTDRDNSRYTKAFMNNTLTVILCLKIIFSRCCALITIKQQQKAINWFTFVQVKQCNKFFN